MRNSIAIAVLLVLVLVGAVGASELIVREPARTDGRVTVVYWEKWAGFEADAMREIVDDFNASQDRIFVQFLSVSNIGQKAMVATAGGIPPDVAGLFGPNLAQYAYNNAVIPLDEFAADAGIDPRDYIRAYWDMCEYKGKLWALPSCPATTALHYNRAMLREAGWNPDEPPCTMEELSRMDELVFTKSGNQITKMGFLPADPGWWPWCWGYFFGGELWDGSEKLTMTTAENVRGFEWMASFAKKYGNQQVTSFQEGFGGFKSSENPFMANKVASELQGAWMANFIKNFNPKLDYGVAPFPHPADRPDLANSTVIDLDILVIPRGARHPKEAFEFIRYVQRQEVIEKLCRLQQKNSPLVKVSKEFLTHHPNKDIATFQMLASSPRAFGPPKTPIWPQWADEIKTATQYMTSGAKTPARALADVQRKMQPLQDAISRREEVLGISGASH